MSDEGRWCLIESDPGVFTELISNLGVSGVQVQEIWDLNSITTKDAENMYGLVFLFKVPNQSTPSHAGPTPEEASEHLFFANQVINNACATQAILSILLNCADISLGNELSNFKEFTASFPPDMKGLAISNSDLIRSVHNSFARSDPFVNEMHDSAPDKEEDLYHFIAYMPIHGAVYELDGLRNGPINHGPVINEDWITKAKETVLQRISSYGDGEIHFNLMAITRDQMELYEEELEELEGRLLSLPDEQSAQAQALRNEMYVVKERLAQEKQTRTRWKRENELRKHNFIPMIYNLLRILAERNELQPLVTRAQEKAQARQSQRREKH